IIDAHIKLRDIDRGAFEGAIDWRLARFGDFPAALAARRGELEGKTVVAYCTGGIRCEKAVLLMRAEGVAHALQLEGGVLGYFEQAAGAPHWRGDCVVFDDRGALDTRLQPA
ncbi:MAG TPA: sulfurtransferase, partial [Burkholderiaceae bacterium]|nr:sulfurtransferase [Burkholderiaceae bacterium]